jgi:tetratricopeptide (TPR) repeat protein
MRSIRVSLTVLGILSLAPVLLAGDSHPAPRRAATGQTEQWGKVNFPVSCAPGVRGTFTKGVALLHSFQYQQADQTFAAVAQQDPNCAMAYWGRAMALYHQLWDWPSSGTLQEGREFIAQAQKRGEKTGREQDYIAAAAAFFQDNPKLSRVGRLGAYSDAMGQLFKKYPKDIEAGAFYALSLVALAQLGPDDLANRRKAIAVLNPLFLAEPNDPGVAHYLIHATDTPVLAPLGLEAARSYARIAPASSHALHMPSHIFTRLGLWQESIESNLAAAAAAAKATAMHLGDSNYQFHALNFLDYAYLQSGQQEKAERLIGELKDVTGATAARIADAQGETAARNALESHNWKEAASLAVPSERVSWQDTTYWVRSIGASRNGDAAGARKDLDKLKESIATARANRKDSAYSASSEVSLMEQEAEAWLALAEGKHEEAVKTLRAAADRDDAAGVDSLTMPAREMLGDMLLELNRPAEALAEYKIALKESPNRFDGLLGAARAAERSHNGEAAREYFHKLVEICGAGADRPELQEARLYLARN